MEGKLSTIPSWLIPQSLPPVALGSPGPWCWCLDSPAPSPPPTARTGSWDLHLGDWLGRSSASSRAACQSDPGDLNDNTQSAQHPAPDQTPTLTSDKHWEMF